MWDFVDEPLTEPEPDPATGYERVQASAEFAELRRRFRRFVFPMSVVFLGWYLVYVLLAAYAPAFMSMRIAGNVTVGLAVVLLEFVATFLISVLYVRFAGRVLDSSAAQIREQIRDGSLTTQPRSRRADEGFR